MVARMPRRQASANRPRMGRRPQAPASETPSTAKLAMARPVDGGAKFVRGLWIETPGDESLANAWARMIDYGSA